MPRGRRLSGRRLVGDTQARLQPGGGVGRHVVPGSSARPGQAAGIYNFTFSTGATLSIRRLGIAGPGQGRLGVLLPAPRVPGGGEGSSAPLPRRVFFQERRGRAASSGLCEINATQWSIFKVLT